MCFFHLICAHAHTAHQPAEVLLFHKKKCPVEAQAEIGRGDGEKGQPEMILVLLGNPEHFRAGHVQHLHPACFLPLGFRKTADLDGTRYLVGNGEQDALVVFDVFATLKAVLGDNNAADRSFLHAQGNTQQAVGNGTPKIDLPLMDKADELFMGEQDFLLRGQQVFLKAMVKGPVAALPANVFLIQERKGQLLALIVQQKDRKIRNIDHFADLPADFFQQIDQVGRSSLGGDLTADLLYDRRFLQQPLFTTVQAGLVQDDRDLPGEQIQQRTLMVADGPPGLTVIEKQKSPQGIRLLDGQNGGLEYRKIVAKFLRAVMRVKIFEIPNEYGIVGFTGEIQVEPLRDRIQVFPEFTDMIAAGTGDPNKKILPVDIFPGGNPEQVRTLKAKLE